MAKPVGRPSKYTPALLKKSRDYLKNYLTKYEDQFPNIEGLSLVIDVRRSTIYNWIEDDDKTEFSDIAEKINATQAQVLKNKGLTGDFNSNITKLLLTKHGYHDKVDNDQTGNIRVTITGIERKIIDPNPDNTD